MPTLTPSQSCLLAITQVDSTNTPLVNPDPTYGPPTFTNSDPTIIQLVSTRAVPTGILGTSTVSVTETSSDPTKPAISGSITLNVVGPAAAALAVTGTVVDGH